MYLESGPNFLQKCQYPSQGSTSEVQLSEPLQREVVLSVADKTKKTQNLIKHKGSDYNHIMWSKCVQSDQWISKMNSAMNYDPRYGPSLVGSLRRA